MHVCIASTGIPQFFVEVVWDVFSRDARMFEEVEVIKPDIEGMIDPNEVGV